MNSLIEQYIDDKKVIICGGSGGVGKTTTSAAIAIKAAEKGKKVLVLTIDPARRLADSLGIKIGNEEVKVSDEIFKSAGIEIKGELYAMMLDMKRSFDDLIDKIAPNNETRDKILNNRLYNNVTSALSGSQEYIAMEKLYDVYSKGEYDLIVLDTPPTRHAVDFLNAPKKMVDFLDAGIINIMLKTYFKLGGWGLKFLKGGSNTIFALVEKVTGGEILRDVSEFFMAFEGMYDGFKDRSKDVTELLKSNVSTILIVLGPQYINIDEAFFFYDKISEMGIHFGFFVMNRMHIVPEDFIWTKNEKKEVKKLLEEDSAVILEWINKYIAVSKSDRESAMMIKNRTRQPVYLVKEFTEDIHDIPSLYKFVNNLLSSEIIV